MPKLAFVADVHLGNHKRRGGQLQASLNVRCREGLDVLAKAVDFAAGEECDVFVVLGDLFDTASPLPQLVAETVRALDSPMRVDLLGGNHDQVSQVAGDNALAPFGVLDNERVHVAEHATTVTFPAGPRKKPTSLLLVPYRPGNAAEWLPDVLAEYAGGDVFKTSAHRLLGLHMGIQDGETAHYLKGAHDSIEATALGDLCKQHGIEAAFAGNWHDHRKWRLAWPDPHADSASGERRKRKGNITNSTLDIVQCGALVPTGWDNAGLTGYGLVTIWDNGKITHHAIPGPRFIKIDKGAQMPPDAVAAAENGCNVYVDETVDRAASKQAARDAAHAARSTDTLQKALGAYVEKMALPDGVDRKTVLAKCKEYLA